LQKLKSQATRLWYANRVMTSCVSLPLLTNPLGCTLSMCASPQAHFACLLFWAKIFLGPKVGIWFWFGFIQESSICPCRLTTLLVILIMFMMHLLEVFSLYFTYNLMWYICVTPCPTRKKVMFSSHSMFLLLIC